ncbi:MAG: iron-containing alcohol dehydrogenase [Candidatus Sumerlaeia bacterium]
MNNFVYHNPVELIFGKGTIAQLADNIPSDKRVLMCYGGGSIKRNGVYDQTMAALKNHKVAEIGGVEPNPRYETLMKAVELGRQEQCDYVLAVGGGSVLDGVKFVAAAIPFDDGDPWKILSEQAKLKTALPLASVLTLPATGSEANMNSVISRDSTQEKLAFANPLVYPQFSIIDPETHTTLPERQTKNGIIDAFVHVMEQYATYDVNAPLQTRQAEAILLTLLEEGPKALENPEDYDIRANIAWAATQALNGLINRGVPQDWSTHLIGHEITALWGLDHAQTLAVVLPANMRYNKEAKSSKLIRMAEAVWGIDTSACADPAGAAIDKTEEFFRSLGVKTRLKEYDITEGIEKVAERIDARGISGIGERQNIGKKEIQEILDLCRE